ncbi:MAG TPA: hypothetical protein VFX12_03745 [Vicinamibacterales bacterium]|nr:hypothetical protein [Vicinamibacterales bacterium]
MRFRTRAALLAIVLAAALAACGGGSNLFGPTYEYEEDLTLSLDGSATLVVNSSVPALVALRGLPLSTDPAVAVDRNRVRALYASPYDQVRRVSVWTRRGRRFVGITLRIPDIRQLTKAPPFAWSTYRLFPKDGEHVFEQRVGPSAFRPGTLPKVGWDGSEIVAFRLHLPSRINYHNARMLDTNAPRSVQRGNILTWEQHLTDRLEGVPVVIDVRMDSQSILYRTLWLFAGAFAAAVLVLGLLIWFTMRRGAAAEESRTANGQGLKP